MLPQHEMIQIVEVLGISCIRFNFVLFSPHIVRQNLRRLLEFSRCLESLPKEIPRASEITIYEAVYAIVIEKEGLQVENSRFFHLSPFYETIRELFMFSEKWSLGVWFSAVTPKSNDALVKINPLKVNMFGWLSSASKKHVVQHDRNKWGDTVESFWTFAYRHCSSDFVIYYFSLMVSMIDIWSQRSRSGLSRAYHPSVAVPILFSAFSHCKPWYTWKTKE